MHSFNASRRVPGSRTSAAIALSLAVPVLCFTLVLPPGLLGPTRVMFWCCFAWGFASCLSVLSNANSEQERYKKQASWMLHKALWLAAIAVIIAVIQYATGFTQVPTK